MLTARVRTGVLAKGWSVCAKEGGEVCEKLRDVYGVGALVGGLSEGGRVLGFGYEFARIVWRLGVAAAPVGGLGSCLGNSGVSRRAWCAGWGGRRGRRGLGWAMGRGPGWWGRGPGWWGRDPGWWGGAGGRAHAAGAPPPGRHVGWCVGVKRS